MLTLKLASLLSSFFRHNCSQQETNLEMLNAGKMNFDNKNNLYKNMFNHIGSNSYFVSHQTIQTNNRTKKKLLTLQNQQSASKHAHNHNAMRKHTCHRFFKNQNFEKSKMKQNSGLNHKHTKSKSNDSKRNETHAFEMDHSILRRKRGWFKNSINLQSHSTIGTYNFKKTKRKISCILEGHLNSKNNWYGYIANVTVKLSASMHFEITYHSDRCCPNILFYLSDEAAMVREFMDCHQKELLLSPRDERMLQLSERNPWAGCQISRDKEGNDIMICKGSRSFSHNFSSFNSLTTWYVAVSDCFSFRGLDLFYRVNIVGNVGECHDISNNHQNYHSEFNYYSNHRNISFVQMDNLSYKAINKHATKAINPPDPLSHDNNHQIYIHSNENFISPYFSTDPTQKNVHTPRQALDKRPSFHGSEYCEYVGNVNSSHSWYGFMKNISIKKGGTLKYYFTQPVWAQTQNVILYREEDVVKLDWEMSCWEKEGLIPAMMIKYQIIDMHHRAFWAGCRLVESGRHENLTCTGLKKFGEEQKVHLSLSNCRSHQGVLLHYRLQIYGHDGACSSSLPLFQYFFFNFLIIHFMVLCFKMETICLAEFYLLSDV